MKKMGKEKEAEEEETESERASKRERILIENSSVPKPSLIIQVFIFILI